MKMKAKAAVFMGANIPFAVREFEVGQPPEGYGQLELVASGLCGTDVHIYRGKLSVNAPAIIGHEFVGRITAARESEAAALGLKIGDAVIADIAVPCGQCMLCKSGDDANCVNMRVTNGGNVEEAPHFWGGYGEVNFTPLANLVKVPETVDPAVAATFACPGPTVVHAVSLARRGGVRIEECKVAVVQGLGPVGIFAVLYLKKLGVEKVYAVTATEKPEREALVKELGADRVFCLEREGEAEVTALLQQENGGLGADLCLEASGAPTAVCQGIAVLRNRGVYLIPGQYSNSGGITVEPQMLTFKALQILGSSQYSMCDVKAYLDFLEANPQIHGTIAKLASRYTIAQVNEAFEKAQKGCHIKALFVKED